MNFEMKEQPLVSVIMPVYNAEKYIAKAIDSVLNQTYSNFELILINDASKDSSKEIIGSYTDKRIVYLENPQNLGIVKTRNSGIRAARGNYIAVLDNDDISKPFRLSSQVSFLEEHEDYGVCGSFYEIIDGHGKITGKVELPIEARQIKTFLLFHNCFCNSTVTVRADFLKEQLYNENFNMIEDYYLYYSVSKKAKLHNLPTFTTQYRIHGSNTSIEKLDAMRQLRIEMDRQILTELNAKFSEEELLLYSNFINGNFQYFTNIRQVLLLEKWLMKFYDQLAGAKYDKATMQRIIGCRWVLLVWRTKKFPGKLLVNRLLPKFGLRYFVFIMIIFREKYSTTKSLY